MKVILSNSIFDTDDILYAFENEKTDNKVKIRFRGDADRALLLDNVTISEFLDCMRHIHNLINNDVTLVDLDGLLAFQKKEEERLARKEEENSTFKPPANVGDDRPSTHTHGGTDAHECTTGFVPHTYSDLTTTSR